MGNSYPGHSNNFYLGISNSNNSHLDNSSIGSLPLQKIPADGNSHLDNSDPENFHQDNSQLGIVRVRVVQVGIFPRTEICHFKTDFIRRFANQFFFTESLKFVSRKLQLLHYYNLYNYISMHI